MSRDNYNPYRIVGAKKIDVWFYEEGDMRRTHRIVYELIVLPLYGVCENSFLDYRHHSDELLELFIQPPYIEAVADGDDGQENAGSRSQLFLRAPTDEDGPHIQEKVLPSDGRAAPQTARRCTGRVHILEE